MPKIRPEEAARREGHAGPTPDGDDGAFKALQPHAGLEPPAGVSSTHDRMLKLARRHKEQIARARSGAPTPRAQ